MIIFIHAKNIDPYNTMSSIIAWVKKINIDQNYYGLEIWNRPDN